MTLKTYETICILNPNVSNDTVEEKVSAWRKMIEERGGTVHKISHWGKKTLAYEVKKFRQGYFLLLHMDADNDCKNELERQFKISEDVIKFMTVRLLKNQIKMSQDLVERIATEGKAPSPDEAVPDSEDSTDVEKPEAKVTAEESEADESPEIEPEPESEPEPDPEPEVKSESEPDETRE